MSLVRTRLGLDQNFVHHAEILVQQDMTVKHKRAGDCRIAEIHADLHAVIGRPRPRPVRNFDRISHVFIPNRFSIHLQHLKVDLMDVESVGFERAVFDRPILHRSDFGGDGRFLVGLEDSLFLSVHRDVKLDGTVGAAKFLGEVKLALGRYRLIPEIRKLKRGR